MSKLIVYLNRMLPNWLRNLKIFKAVKSAVYRDDKPYKEINVDVKRTYVDYDVDFKYFGSVNSASRAFERGIENTLLKNVFKLHKNEENDLVALDVGSNFGYLSMVWSQTLCANGSVFAFEANPHVFESFSKTKSYNNQDNLNIQNKAVGDENGSCELFISGGTSNTIASETSPEAKSVVVDMISLDGDETLMNLSKIDFIKIDVDGIELKILQGAKQLIKKFSPLIIVETNDNIEIIRFFQSMDYSIFDMDLKPYKTGDKLPVNIFCKPIGSI
ncbi:FkbM family methyltransferase [Winogradskyella sp. 3972H.M.0a.05]|uniref:FkbM family methyltransferase n=1 Tax=Winogradskyella sp. 3972H.M.0a.05 TaxID=2950277 RepID=UPI00339A67D4